MNTFESFDTPHGAHSHRAEHVQHMRQRLTAGPREALSAAEQQDLLALREEEKLARDVYATLAARWHLRPFENIVGAEQAHMDMVQAALEHQGLPDPVQDLPAGRFASAPVQALYERLCAQGLQSPQEAVAVGLHVEELDIADLRAAAARTASARLRELYAELERGSRNHLRAFFRWQQQLGGAYEPRHLPAQDFQAIATSPKEACWQ